MKELFQISYNNFLYIIYEYMQPETFIWIEKFYVGSNVTNIYREFATLVKFYNNDIIWDYGTKFQSDKTVELFNNAFPPDVRQQIDKAFKLKAFW